jgi:putative flippase GtrA
MSSVTVPASVAALIERPGARQFVKFCIVGASSFVIDIGLLNLFLYKFSLPLLIAKALSFLIAICNGFFWNRRWTFRATTGNAGGQYSKFFLTNFVGLLLNLSIMTGAILLATKLGLIHTNRELSEIVTLLLDPEGRKSFNPLTVNLATIVATGFVTVWNFLAAKFFTFKQPTAQPLDSH